MNITNTIITRQGETTTANARYQLEYNVTNGILNRISATLSELPSDDNPDGLYIGNIFWENGSVNCSFQMTMKAVKFFEDFENFMTEIKADAEELSIK